MTRSNTFKGLWDAVVAVARRAAAAGSGVPETHTARRFTCACGGLAEFLDDRIRMMD
jgi:hypothetical protein